jgi:hypothetical protein
MKHSFARIYCAATLAVVLLPAAGLAAGPDFAREVRPVLSNRCFKCHGPDEGNRQAGLRLDLREEALDFGAVSAEGFDGFLDVHSFMRWLVAGSSGFK